MTVSRCRGFTLARHPDSYFFPEGLTLLRKHTRLAEYDERASSVLGGRLDLSCDKAGGIASPDAVWLFPRFRSELGREALSGMSRFQASWHLCRL